MQPCVFPFDNEYGNRVKRNGWFESDDQRLEDLSQLQMAAGSLRDFKYELRAGLQALHRRHLPRLPRSRWARPGELHFLRSAISHRRSPIWNILLHYTLKIRERHCRRM